MYSVVLMAAMTTPADLPSVGRLFRGGCLGSCVGCTGCVGSCVGCTGCVGSCVGCTGCTGCAGSACHGYACGGCGGRFFGWRAGCWSDGGWRVWFSCHGSGACHGYAYAGVSFGFAGCYGSCTGSFTNYFSYWPAPAAPAPMQTTPPAPAPMKPAEPQKDQPKADPMKPLTAAPASVIVTLPADATLLANGVRTRQTGPERRFSTPELTPFSRHMYTLTAEISRHNQTITETIDVEVFPGQVIHVTFRKLLAFVGQEPASIAGK